MASSSAKPMGGSLELVRTLGNLLRQAGDALLAYAESERVADACHESRPYHGQDVKLMPVAVYARRVGRSRHTVQKWVEAGLPSVPGPRGVLVEVAPADRWLANGGLRQKT